MATERRLALGVVVALAAASAGCTTTNKCKSQTVLLTVALDAAAAAADALEIDVTIDGATTQSTIAHAAGSGSGTIEVRFPSGYPAGKSAQVTVVALQAGSPLGLAQTSLTLPKGCAVAAVSVVGSTPGDDLAGFALDFTMPPDLTGSTDIAMCPSSTEDCFNGVDDNCDGLVDCADPQCTGGATPQAECVPDPGSAVTGTLSTTTCPMAYPTNTPLYAGFTAGSCATGSCACFNGINGSPSCSATLVNKGGTITSCDVALGGTTIFSNATNASSCVSFAALSATAYYALGYTTSGSCNAPSGGNATKVAPTWATTDAFCGGGKVGGGCAAGKVCMPVAANHCVLETGSQTMCTSVPGYSVPNATQFFSGFDDSTRACSCTCSPTITCNASFYTNGSCTTGPFGQPAGCYKGWTAYTGATIAAPSGTCGAGAGESGATTTTGFERTVCCIN